MSQIVRVFFNHQAFENCAFVYLLDKETTHFEKKGNVTVLYNQDEIVGYNILDERFHVYSNGYQKMDETLLSLVNDCLTAQEVEKLDADMKNRIVVGKVVECINHPDSDHLHICQVDIASEILQIVCGASNVCEGARVVVACDNAVMPDGKWIKAGKLRGIDSYGMLCSEFELGLILEHKRGLLLLDDSYEIGKEFEGGKRDV